jgi:L-ascorbate metabolism protein UlaG (beta-lactamase superfamily)
MHRHDFIYVAIGCLFLLTICFSCNRASMQYVSNPNLKTIKQGHKGNAMRNGRFVNYEDVSIPSFAKVMKWQMSKNPQKTEKKQDTWLPEQVSCDHIFDDTTDKIVWLGHATFLITLNGKHILTDPVFGDVPFVKRLLPPALDPAKASPISYVLLSHGHFDHCDKKSMQQLARLNPNMKVLAPLGAANVLRRFDKQLHIQEAGWYQQFAVGEDSIEIFFMPSFHWFKRGLSDTNKMLWGSYIIRYNGKTFYFMGDSGYNTHFKEIATYFSEIDYCLMGVGAYKPSYMMKTSHTSPEDAVKAFHDLQGKTFIPMHYGTFDLADEPLGEPLRMLHQMTEQKIMNGRFLPLIIGKPHGIGY